MLSEYPEPKDIIPLVERILLGNPGGISEYELLSKLAEQQPFFRRNAIQDQNLALFRQHFMLFHCLYLLEQSYVSKNSGRLIISALDIRLLTNSTDISAWEQRHPSGEMTTPDSVRDYYLDLSNLQNTGADEVDELLGKFWLALSRYEARDDALNLLGLQDPVDDSTIRQKYRELVMQHHPDRGGDVETIQQLNDAVSKLLPKA